MDHCPRCGTQDSGQGRHECPIELPELPELPHVEPLVIECPPRQWHGPEPRSTLEWEHEKGDSDYTCWLGRLYLQVYPSYVWKWRIRRVPEGRQPWHILDSKIVAESDLDASVRYLQRALWECEMAARTILGEV